MKLSSLQWSSIAALIVLLISIKQVQAYDLPPWTPKGLIPITSAEQAERYLNRFVKNFETNIFPTDGMGFAVPPVDKMDHGSMLAFAAAIEVKAMQAARFVGPNDLRLARAYLVSAMMYLEEDEIKRGWLVVTYAIGIASSNQPAGLVELAIAEGYACHLALRETDEPKVLNHCVIAYDLHKKAGAPKRLTESFGCFPKALVKGAGALRECLPSEEVKELLGHPMGVFLFARPLHAQSAYYQFDEKKLREAKSMLEKVIAEWPEARVISELQFVQSVSVKEWWKRALGEKAPSKNAMSSKVTREQAARLLAPGMLAALTLLAQVDAMLKDEPASKNAIRNLQSLIKALVKNDLEGFLKVPDAKETDRFMLAYAYSIGSVFAISYGDKPFGRQLLSRFDKLPSAPEGMATAFALSEAEFLTFAAQGWFRLEEPNRAYQLSRRAYVLCDPLLRTFATSSADAKGPISWVDVFVRVRFTLSTFVAMSVNTGQDIPKALEAIQWWRTTAAGTALRAATIRLSSNSPILASLLKEHFELTQSLSTMDTSGRNTDEIFQQSEKVRRRLIEIERQIARRFPQYSQLRAPLPVPVSAIQSVLKDETLLVVMRGYFSVITCTVSAQTAPKCTQAKMSAQQLEMPVKAVQQSLQLRSGQPPLPFDFQNSYRLYHDIIEPILPDLRRTKHLLVVSDGELEGLPLGVLPMEMPSVSANSPDAYSNVKWLATEFNIEYLVDVPTFHLLRTKRPGAPALQPFLGFGNPVLGPPDALANRKVELLLGNPDSSADDLASPNDLRQLPSVPDTQILLDQAAAFLSAPPSSKFTQREATETHLKKLNGTMALANAQVLVFATHGLIANNDTLEPGLVFTPPSTPTQLDDGYLTASEAAELHLNADWVILSACNTAASNGRRDPRPLSGLARGFFYAGTRRLLVTHWSVSSRAASAIVIDTLKNWKQGLPPSVAMGAAVRRMISTPDTGLSHPAYWGAFVLVGGS